MKHILLLLILTLTTTNTRAESSNTTATTKQPQLVYTGVYLMNVYDLNLNEYSYYADFYIWFKWKGELDPMDIEFVNSVEKWSITQTAFYDTLQVLSDGYNYNGYRVEGRFFHSFLLEHFPLDKHNLNIQIENTTYPADSLTYVPINEDVKKRNGFIMPGWNINAVQLSQQNNFYVTDFGNPDIGRQAYSNCTFTVGIERPVNYFIFKLLLPLFIVMLASLGALLLNPNYLDARISLPIGSLLTTVFLQQSYQTALPEVGHMVLMDKIYVVAYCLLAFVLLQVILSGNTLKNLPQNAETQQITHIQRRERWLAICLLLAFGVSVLLLVAWG